MNLPSNQINKESMPASLDTLMEGDSRPSRGLASRKDRCLIRGS